MKACSKCGKSGHNKATCGKPMKFREPSFQRQCQSCHGYGHNARTCRGIVMVAEEGAASGGDNGRKSLLQAGREIRERESAKIPRQAIDGVVPKRGLWLVNTNRRRVAGVISHIRKTGAVVWRDHEGVFVDSSQESIMRSGYKYLADLSQEKEGWMYLHGGTWESSNTMKQVSGEDELNYMK